MLNAFFQKSFLFRDNYDKYDKARQAIDDLNNTAQKQGDAICMPVM
jgi:hypothetical protein